MLVNEVFPIFNTVQSIYIVTERTLVLIVNVCNFFFIFVIPDYAYTSVGSRNLSAGCFHCPTVKTPRRKRGKSSEDSSQADWFSFHPGTMVLSIFFIILIQPLFFNCIITHQSSRLFDLLLFLFFLCKLNQAPFRHSSI